MGAVRELDDAVVQGADCQVVLAEFAVNRHRPNTMLSFTHANI
jgi:hypothetical protein